MVSKSFLLPMLFASVYFLFGASVFGAILLFLLSPKALLILGWSQGLGRRINRRI